MYIPKETDIFVSVFRFLSNIQLLNKITKSLKSIYENKNKQIKE